MICCLDDFFFLNPNTTGAKTNLLHVTLKGLLFSDEPATEAGMKLTAHPTKARSPSSFVTHEPRQSLCRQTGSTRGAAGPFQTDPVTQVSQVCTV